MPTPEATRPPLRDPLAGVEIVSRLAEQLRFCLEIDRVKQILRGNFISDSSRRENDAEHQWHVAVMAMVLAEHAAEAVDVGRVVGMLLVHDLVEIDAGDVNVYDSDARASAVALEAAAADRIFRMLPEDQAAWMRGLWEEFEAKSSADARFAGALDRLQPLLMNSASAGGGWAAHGVTADRVRELNSVISLGSDALWSAASQIIDAAVAGGVLAASAGVTAPPGQPPPGQPTGDPD